MGSRLNYKLGAINEVRCLRAQMVIIVDGFTAAVHQIKEIRQVPGPSVSKRRLVYPPDKVEAEIKLPFVGRTLKDKLCCDIIGCPSHGQYFTKCGYISHLRS